MTFPRNITIYIVLQFILSNLVNAEILNHSDTLTKQLQQAYRSQRVLSRPRTQYLCEKGNPCYTNRLILEQSPYLLQHAHNPIDWYAWGEEAFEKAKRENKPVFLSIGYSACHWCHVMEKESFDNLEIARILNKHFVAIKVDREQRPDIDELFGGAVMIFQGQQGWPMSLFLTPDAHPFFGGGYYSANEFKTLINKMSDEWKNEQKTVINKAQKIIDQLKNASTGQKKTVEMDDHLRRRAIKDVLSIVDNYLGGFGGGEKFPREPWLYLLLDDSIGKHNKNDSLDALQLSLTKMAHGGINDQLAGGFHRYTTDPYWKTPHFEKMLYNQALLIPLYLGAHRIEEDPYYLRVAKQTADFMLNNMRDEKGAFYSSIDADSDGVEGRYYVWNIAEWNKNINRRDGDLVTELYDIDEHGETEHSNNVLYLSENIYDYAKSRSISVKTLFSQLDDVHEKLLLVRHKRIKPGLDKKIIMAWNGLTIVSLADAYLYLQDDKYLKAAIEAAEFVWTDMRKGNDFYRTHYNGYLSKPAQLSDYVYYLQALIKLYDIDQKKDWLNRAILLQEVIDAKFWDQTQGGFYNSVKDSAAPLPFREKTAFDKTLISANAVAAKMLIRLYHRTGDDTYKDKAKKTLSFFKQDVVEVPSAYSGLLVASRELRSGEINLPVYAARGHIRIDAEIKKISKQLYGLSLDLVIENNWHINSHTPLEKNLIATGITLDDKSTWSLSNVSYPAQQILKLGYSENSLALYEGRVRITSKLSSEKKGLSPVIILRLQACNDKICLPPEKLSIHPRVISED